MARPTSGNTYTKRANDAYEADKQTHKPTMQNGHITTDARKQSATVVQHSEGPNGGSTRYRFPMPDKAHARAALQDLPKAKGLSSAEKSKIRGRAKRMLGENDA